MDKKSMGTISMVSFWVHLLALDMELIHDLSLVVSLGIRLELDL